MVIAETAERSATNGRGVIQAGAGAEPKRPMQPNDQRDQATNGRGVRRVGAGRDSNGQHDQTTSTTRRTPHPEDREGRGLGSGVRAWAWRPYGGVGLCAG